MALVKCPECGNEVSDQASMCPNCGYNVQEHFKKIKQEEERKRIAESLKKQQAQQNNQRQYTQPQKSESSSGCLIWIIVIVVLFLIWKGGGLNSCTDSDVNSRTCKACHREFTDSSNTRNIAYTNLCNNCEKNVEWGKKVLQNYN